jgi:hypothetical protein
MLKIIDRSAREANGIDTTTNKMRTKQRRKWME